MYRNRGEIPNIFTDNNNNNNNNGNDGYRAPHYSNYWNGRFFIVQYDKNFIAIELIATFLILLIGFAVYLFTYKVSYQDPIATIKDNYIKAQLISIGSTIVITGLITFFTRSSKEKLIRNLKIVAMGSTLIIILLLGFKLNMDKQYNKETFATFYEQSNNNNKDSKTISLGLLGAKITNQKETYIEESVKAYTNFSIKTILYIIIHLLVIIIIFYLAFRLSTIERKKEKLTRDDKILYDEEKNIKF